MLQHIFLFGHRKQHGKDTCCDIAEELLKEWNVQYCRTFYAKQLKIQASASHNLDASLMEDNDYKASKPEHLNGKSVRDILIEVGNNKRAEDPDYWVRAALNDLLESQVGVGIISDFRFPNEALAYEHLITAEEKPMIHKVLVHRPDGVFAADGSDDQLPDLANTEDEKYWDYVIMNNDTTENWKSSLREQVKEVLQNHVQVYKSK